MKLFHKYYSRKLLFAIEVLDALQGAKEQTLNWGELTRLSNRLGMTADLRAEVLNVLTEESRIVRVEDTSIYRLDTSWTTTTPKLPTSKIEEDYLQMILRLPQAEQFLSRELRDRLTDPQASILNTDAIQTIEPNGEQTQLKLSQPEFRMILDAIEMGCAIRYRYISEQGKAAMEKHAVPWRLQYSAFDNRWWIILYTLKDHRCVKIALGSISDVQLEKHIQVKEADILKAREKDLAAEPAILQVKNTKNALERCFFVMDRQQFEDSELLEDGSAKLTYRYYHFETSDLLRRLLYLGPAVALIGPPKLRKALLEHVERALNHFRAEA